MSQPPVIIAAEKIIDNEGGLFRVEYLWEEIKKRSNKRYQLTIDPLNAGWHTPVAEGHFRSGCAPIEALGFATELIEQEEAEAVLIRGTDHIKSDYSREERVASMSIYGENRSITQAYDHLADQFIQFQQITDKLFSHCKDALFENYWKTFQLQNKQRVQRPESRWFNPLTKHFRGVDCANPMVDFDGAMILVSSKLASQLKVPASDQISVKGVNVQVLEGDGYEFVPQIATYQHLQKAYQLCNQQAGIDFKSQYLNGKGLLEVYTCYPVVPMAFLLTNGFVDSIDQLPDWLENFEVTITGGMNLARAPWNNPALNGLISAYQQLLKANDKECAMVHGNGGLGYRQGVAILGRP